MKLIDLIRSPWAITRDHFEYLADFYRVHVRGGKIDLKELKQEARAMGATFPGGDDEKPYETVNGVAVIPVTGVLSRRTSLFSWLFGGMSTVQIGDAIEAAKGDGAVRAIMLDVDSPGGTVAGTQELAAIVYAARGAKPITAYTGGMMASAAYWIGSAADQVLISGDTNMVGSIGVIATHVDMSKAYEEFGVKVTEVTGGKWKDKPSSYRPLDADDRAVIQYEVDCLYSAFVADVAKHRGVSTETVLSDMADGRVFVGRDAIEAGLVDGVSTRQEAVESLATTDAHGLGRMLGAARPRSASDVAAAVTAGGESLSTVEDHSMEYTDITLDDLKAQRPDLIQALTASATEAGATAERERIQGIEALAMPGHEALINALKADGSTSPEVAAVKILQAEKAANATHLQNLQADAPTGAASAEPEAPKPKASAEDASVPIDERARAAWDAEPATRTEFGGDFETYLAYRRNTDAGLVKYRRNAEQEDAA